MTTPVVESKERCACGCCHAVDYGPCTKYEGGGNTRCVYCDHGEACHADQSRPFYNGPLHAYRRYSVAYPKGASQEGT